MLQTIRGLFEVSWLVGTLRPQQNVLYSFHSLVSTMKKIVSPSFFVQFGASGLVFCSSVYVVSVVIMTISHRIQLIAIIAIFHSLADRSYGETDEIHHSHVLFGLHGRPDTIELLLGQ